MALWITGLKLRIHPRTEAPPSCSRVTLDSLNETHFSHFDKEANDVSGL